MSQLIHSFSLSPTASLELRHGDLTLECVDAIVNAANNELVHGGGVAGAIVRAGGKNIQEESDAWVIAHGPISHTAPAYTTAGKLSCKYIIHAVGPIWGEGNEDQKLTEAIESSLALADQFAVQSIAFPAISTGIFGFPKNRAAQVILNAIFTYFQSSPHTNISLVRLVLLESTSVKVFLDAAIQQHRD